MPRVMWDNLIVKRTKFLTLPIPVRGQVPVKYMPYDEIKGQPAKDHHLPTLKPRTAPTAEAVAGDKEIGKTVPALVAGHNKSAKFWTANNV
jgi:hypothetical protein